MTRQTLLAVLATLDTCRADRTVAYEMRWDIAVVNVALRTADVVAHGVNEWIQRRARTDAIAAPLWRMATWVRGYAVGQAVRRSASLNSLAARLDWAAQRVSAEGAL